MQLQNTPQHKPGSIEVSQMLRQALKEKGFILTPHPDMRDVHTKMDLRLNINLCGAATSTIDAAYETYDLESDNPDEPLSMLKEVFGNTIVLVAYDHVEPVHLTPTSPASAFIYRGCIIHRGRVEQEAPNIQTIYLAMKGQFPNIPAYSELTSEQKTMITNHIGMLVNYIEE